MKVYPKNYEVEEAPSNQLVVDAPKRIEMMGKVNELIGDSPKEFKVLVDELEHFFIFERGEHYTSEQLKEIVESVRQENEPKPVVEPVEDPIEIVEPK